MGVWSGCVRVDGFGLCALEGAYTDVHTTHPADRSISTRYTNQPTDQLPNRATSIHRIRHAPHLLEDLWFSELPLGTHSDLYAHAQWTHDVHSFMATMEGSSLAAGGSVGLEG